MNNDISEEFRNIIRAQSQVNKKTVHQYLFDLFNHLPNKGGKKLIGLETFIQIFKPICNSFRSTDLEDIFYDCELDDNGVLPLDQLVLFCQLSVSKARSLALKVRKAIVAVYNSDKDYKKAFSSITSNNTYADKQAFRHFCEELLDTNISESDNDTLYALYDMNGDGKVTYDDFVEFIAAETPTALKALSSGDEDCIVDLRITTTKQQQDALSNIGFTQVLQEKDEGSLAVTAGSFGKLQSMWFWKRRQGTFNGKLKPIVSILLEPTYSSSALVLNGYTCLPLSISGQWIWIKRASTFEEEMDAIIDLTITSGRMKNASDSVWCSPGVGWIRVEGNFGKGLFSSTDYVLWYLPGRTRTMDMSSPGRDAMFLTEEAKQYKLFLAVKRALRHFVPLSDFGDLKVDANESEKSSQVDVGAISLFHKFSGSKRSLTLSRLENLLMEVGIKLDKNDCGRYIFHYFNIRQDKYVSREEFFTHLSLNDAELDQSIDAIRNKFTLANNGQSSIKFHRMLHDIFKMFAPTINLTLQGLRNMILHLNIFLTDDELGRLFKLVDKSHDGKIDEKDFSSFFSSLQDSNIRKAHRIKEASFILKRWLIRGSGLTNSKLSSSLWRELGKQHMNSYGDKFPDYLNASSIMFSLSTLGCFLTLSECKEVVFMIAPEENGKIYQLDLDSFIKRTCRPYGELLNAIENNYLNLLLSIYKEYRLSKRDGESSQVSYSKFEDALSDIQSVIIATYKGKQPLKNGKTNNREFFSPLQIQLGIEAYAKEKNKSLSTAVNNIAQLNLEEWVALASLTRSIVAEDEIYGIDFKKLLHGICDFTVDKAILAEEHIVSVDMIAQELQGLILHEAKKCGSQSKTGANLNYQAVFDLFDEDGKGTITRDEFQKFLIRLQLVESANESQVIELLGKIDKQKKGFITLEDLKNFVENGGNNLSSIEDYCDNYEINFEMDKYLSSNTPPAVITRNAECDWLLWSLWREACKIDHVDPEGLVNELEIICAESEVENSPGAISREELYDILTELNLKGIMTKEQFDRSILYLRYDDTKKDKLLIDFESLCRYVIRMGRAFNTMIQEKDKLDSKLYVDLKTNMIKELQLLSSESNPKALSGHDSTTNFSGKKIEKVFRRLDEDGDGRISVKEFKEGLKRIHLKDERKWTPKMIRKLFDETDKNGDGLLSLREFAALINKREIVADLTHRGRDTNLNNTVDDFDQIFQSDELTNDDLIYKKVINVLLNTFPQNSIDKINQIENIKSYIRKYFEKSDDEKSGLVTEERFKAFCRKASIASGLTSLEYRTLIERLRRKSSGVMVVDYLKFLRHLNIHSETVPLSIGENVASKLSRAIHDAVEDSPSFMTLCKMTDNKRTGRIDSDELIHIAKMLDCEITRQEIKGFNDFLPSSIAKGESYNYTQLYDFLTNYHTSPDTVKQEYDFYGTPVVRRNQTNYASSLRSSDTMFQRSTQKNQTYSIPKLNKFKSLQSRSFKEREIVSSILEKIRGTICRLPASFSLFHSFEDLDRYRVGALPIQDFLSLLDELGITLTPSDIYLIELEYSHPQYGGIDYIQFCKEFEESESQRELFPNPGYLAQRLKTLRREGRDPVYLFEAYDLDHTGLISSTRFRQILRSLDLFQTDRQILNCMENYQSIEDKLMICYEEFCKDLQNVVSQNDTSIFHASPSDRNNFPNAASREKWYNRDITPRNTSEENNLSRTSETWENYHGDKKGHKTSSLELPPRYNDKIIRRSLTDRKSQTMLYSDRERFQTPDRFERSPINFRPRSPPSKIGTLMWGKDTPLASKGTTPDMQPTHWVCGVCYYTENPNHLKKCEVCDSINYSNQKEFQLKEQCGNCTFLNGYMAIYCEMCGEKMSNKKRT